MQRTKSTSWEELKASARAEKTASTGSADNSRWEALKKQAWENQARHTKSNQTAIGNWSRGVEQLYKRGQEYYGGDGYKAPNTAYAQELDRYLKQADTVRSYIYANKGLYADVDSVLKDHDSVVAQLQELQKRVAASNDLYSQFENEADYNRKARIEKLNGMTSTEIEEARSSSVMPQEDVDIVNELLRSNMPYRRDYAEQDGMDMWLYDEVEKKRQYISDKYGVAFSEDSADNYNQLTALVNGEQIAYTTADGRNVTWDNLYNNALLAEDLATRLESYSQNADWNEKSQVIDTVADTESDWQIVGELIRTLVPYDWETAEANGVDRVTFDEVERKRQYISDKYGVDLYSDIYGNINTLNELMARLDSQDGEKDTFDFMPYLTNDEKRVLSYIDQTEGRTAALEWHNARKHLYQDRYNRSVASGMSDLGEEAPFWGSVGSVAMSMGSGLEYLTDALDHMVTGEQQYNTLALASSSVRSGVMESIDWQIGNWDAFDFVYSTGMSMADSAAATTTFGNLGGIGLGLGAAAQATNDALDRGMSNSHAFWNGLVAGTFEGLFESVSIGNFYALKEVASAKGRDIAMNIAKTMLVNASEETLTEIANIAYDVICNGDFSQYETMVRRYVDSGMTEAEAKEKAALALGAQVLESGASGMLMGLGFGTTGSARAIAANVTGRVVQNSGYRQVGKTITASEGGVAALQALSAELGKTDADLAKLSAKISDKVAKGDTRQVGRLYAAVQGAVERSNTTALTNKLIEKGYETQTARKVAQVLMEARSGEVTSQAQAELLAALRGDETVMAALSETMESEDSAGYRMEQQLRQMVTAAQGRPSSAPSGGTFPQGKVSAARTVTDDPQGDVQQGEDGTFVRSSGQALRNVKFASVEQGKATVEMEDGSTASLSDVSFADVGQEMVATGITGMEHVSVTSANGIWQVFRQGNYGDNAGEFTKAAMQTFRAGFMGDATVLKQGDSRSAALDPVHAEMIYQMGRLDAEAHYKAQQAKVDAQKKAAAEKNSTAEKKGGVYYGYEGQTIDQRKVDKDHKRLTKAQRVGIDFVKRLAKKFGSQFYFYESYTDAQGNRVYKDRDGNVVQAEKGFYDPKDGSIHIDLTGDTILFTIAHELGHQIKDWSPKQFKKMADIVMEGFSSNDVPLDVLISQQQALAREHGRELTEDEAFEEVICNALEGVMADGKVAQFLQQLEGRDKSLGARVRRFFQDIAQMIRDTLDAYAGVSPGSVEGIMVSQLENTYKQLKKALAEGIYDAGENFRQAEKNSTGEGGVRYSVVDSFVDNNGIQYDSAVLLDTWFFDDTSPRNWGEKLKKYVQFRTNTDPFILPVIDENGVAQQLVFANHTDRVYKTGKSNHKVLDELSETSDNMSKLAVIHIDEILDVAEKDNPYFTSQDPMINHGWLDKNGWLHCAAYVINAKNGGIYRLVVDIAKANDGRHIMYATKGKINRVGTVQVSSLKNRGPGRNPNSNISLSQRDPTVKRKDWEYLFAVQRDDMRTAQRMVDAAAKDAGYTVKAYHGTTNQEEHSTWNAEHRMWDTTYTPITVFKKQYDGQAGHFFSADMDNAGGYGSYLYSVFLMMKNPLVIECNGQSYSSISFDGKVMDTYEWADYARKHRYDGVIFKNVRDGVDYGALSEPTTDYVVFDSNRIKSADAITYDKDGNVIPLSERFNPQKRDIRFSVRQKQNPTVADMLKKEVEKLKGDVEKLKELLKLQRSITGGTKFTASSVEAAARVLKKSAGATGDTAELAGLLNRFYEYIATEQELTWEGVKEQAQAAVDWLQGHVKHQRSDYAQEILDQLHGSRIYLDESQKQEAAHRFGSFNAFRQAVMGSITVANEANTSLDSLWQEMSALYPDVFDADMTAADMPGALADVIDRLRNEDTSLLEYAYNREMIEQDLVRQVYDTYWNVSTLRTFADVKQGQINRLKSEHLQRMQQLKAENRQKVEQMKEGHRAEVQMIRNAYRQRLDSKQKQIVQRYQESRAKAVEGRHKTEMRHKIQKVVKKLNDLLLKETKDKHVPEALKKVVAEALDAVNMDTVGAEERVARYDALIAEATDPDVIEALTQTRDRIQRQGDRMNERLTRLKDVYEELKDAEGDISNAYDEDLAEYIKELADEVGDTPLRDMTLAQLETVYEVYTAVLTTVRNANKAFKEAKGQSIREMGEAVLGELRALKQRDPEQSKAKLRTEEFFWNNEKPIYAFERIGSKVLSMLYRNLQAGQDTYMTDQLDAKAFVNEQKKKHGYDKWDFEKRYEFTSSHGNSFQLSLSQIMSLYAYAKRDQAREHIRKGGIVFDSATELTKKGLLGVKKTVNVENSTAYNISDGMLAEICGSLTQQQAAFVDEMQRYLSDTMGAKGNEVSMELYGIRLFKEKHYFPLKSAPEYMEKAREQQSRQADIKLKNSGMTKATVPKASNPVVLTPFMDVWADHVVDMSMYHSFVLPLEDFYRVYNFKTGQALEEGQTVSVISAINRAHGKAASRYVDQFLKDLNGGVVADPRESIGKALVSKFKKASVMASASVVVQQPTAVIRALAMLDARHFFGQQIDKKKMAALWEEAKQYAPVAAVKEMGYFDTHMGRSARDYLLAKEYRGFGEMAKGVMTDGDYRDELLSKPAAMADQIAWVWIWNAVKRETGANNPNLYATDRAEFFRIAGERFTEVVSRTQVYDSVFSRSANMRSKSMWMNMVTSFMGEPTTSVNMVESALRQWKQGDRKGAWKTACSVYGSVLVNALVVAAVYAMRDDDEDESFAEKYATAFAGKLLEGINPMTYFPFVRDVWSLMQGYDVERADMSVLSDLISGIERVATLMGKETTDMSEEKLAAHNKKLVEAIMNLMDSGFSLAGIPEKNIRRDIMAMVNTWRMMADGVEFDFGKLISGVLKEVKDNVPVVNMLPD